MLLLYSRPRELSAEELLLVALIRRALKDARSDNERLRHEATAWLWWFAPTVAKRAGVQVKVAQQMEP
jgi:hypothetical protein